MKLNTLILSVCVLAGAAAGRAAAGAPTERPSAPDTPAIAAAGDVLASVASPATQDESRGRVRPGRSQPDRRDGARPDKRRGNERDASRPDQRRAHRHDGRPDRQDARPERKDRAERKDRTGRGPR